MSSNSEQAGGGSKEEFERLVQAVKRELKNDDEFGGDENVITRRGALGALLGLGSGAGLAGMTGNARAAGENFANSSGTIGTDSQPLSEVNVQNLHSQSISTVTASITEWGDAADYILYVRDGATRAFNTTTQTEEFSDVDAGTVLQQAGTNANRIVGRGDFSFTSEAEFSQREDLQIELYGSVSIDAAGIKAIEFYACKNCSAYIQKALCNSQQTVVVDIHGSVDCDGYVEDYEAAAGGTFTEDDGSGEGSQTYNRAVVRVKGVSGATNTYGAYFNEVAVHPHENTGVGRGILLDNTPGAANPQANNNVIRGGGQYQDVGIDIQDGVDNLLVNPVVTGNDVGIGLDTGGSFNPTYIIGTTSAEATTTPIDNQSGPVMTWGRVTGPSPKFATDRYVWMDGTGELKFGRTGYGPRAQRFTDEGGNIGTHAVDLGLSSGNTFNLTTELGFDPLGTLTVVKSSSTSATAQFALGEGFRIDKISDPSGEFSTTQGTADSINVYLDGNGDYQIENNDGTAVVKGAVLVGGNS